MATFLRSSLRRFSGALLATIVIASGLTVGTAGLAGADPGDVLSGTVFRDEGWDGAKTSDIGEAGIEVRVTDSAGVTVGPYISDATGAWTTGGTDLVPLTGPYRVTFDIPAGKAPLQPGPLGTDMGSDIQYVAAPDTAVDFGVINPYHFCQDNPDVAFNCYIEGNQVGGGDVLVKTEYLATGDGTNSNGNTGTLESKIADAADIGSTWGLAIQTFNDRDQSNDVVWAAAMEKRFAGYGPAGPDAIYLVNPNTGAIVPGSTITSVDAGADQHDFSLQTAVDIYDPPNTVSEVVDAESYNLVGKQGWGDLDLNEEQDRMYAVNLLDQRLYEFDVDPTSAGYRTSTNDWSLEGLPSQTCSGEIRPWAVGFNEGLVYVGTTCDDATNAYIHTLDPTGAAFTHELTVPLGYTRQPIGNHTGLLADWNPWVADDVWAAEPTGWNGEYGYPQPILSDIEFDRDALIIGIRDRYGDQTGAESPGINFPGDPQYLYRTDSGGDILRACGDGSGGFVLEGGTGCAITNGTDTDFPAAGPGGGEWYDGDNYYTTFGPLRPGHDEISLGGLAVSRPRGDVLMTAYDALDDNFFGSHNHAFSSGLARLDNVTGNKIGQYRVYGNGNSNGPGFGKAAGLGDIEAFCLGAPVVIGNYIWLDADADGIQDPDEEPLAGVVVTLYADDGVTVLGSTSTNADGSYSFIVEPETDYVLGIDPSSASAPVTTVDPTLLKGTFSNEGTDDELDSDMQLQPSGEYTINVTTGDIGENDYSFDAGFVEANHRVGNLVWLDSDDSGTADSGEPGISGLDIQLYVESGDSPGFDAQDELFGTTTTDAVGNYWFDGLVDQTYYIGIPENQTGTVAIDPGSGPETIDPSSLSSSTGINAADADNDNRDDGDPATDFLSLSGPVAVTDNAEPDSEFDSNAVPPRGAEAYIESQPGVVDKDDTDSNLTVDFGFYALPRIGGLLWVDGDLGDAGYDDGDADSGESGGTIEDATVELWEDTNNDGVFNAGDTRIATTTTDASGNYYFNGVEPEDYFVAIPVSQTGQTISGASGDLSDYGSSTGQAAVDAGGDDLDDGEPQTGYASVSGLFNVDLGDNPTDEGGDFADGTADAAEDDANTSTGFFSTDDNSDLTIDFGFIEIPTYEIGNLVWNDANNNGTAEDGETGIAGVLVQLWEDTTGDGNADTLVTSTNTDGAGKYNFPGLPEGDYVVVIPDDQATATTPTALDPFQPSSNGIEADPDADGDNNTNGANALTGAGPVGNASGVLTVGEGVDFADEPTTEQERSDNTAPNESPTGEEDSRSNLTVDFGYYALRLGNQVWEDTGAGANEDNGVFDTDETGIAGVTVELWEDTDDSGDLDPTEDTLVGTTTTDGEGNYWFEGLVDGTDYIVAIPEADNNGATEPLEALQSSTGQTAAAGGADNLDDGDPAASINYLSVSTAVSVSASTAPTGEVDTVPATDNTEAEANAAGSNIPDANSDLYIDFGFTEAPTYEIGNLVWNDANNNGEVDAATESGIAGVLVQLWEDTTGDGNADTLVTSTNTNATGNYNFAGLPAGDYVVVIPDDQATATTPTALDPFQPSSNGIESDPDTDRDNNTNGANALTGPGPVGNASGVLTVGEGTDLADEPINETDESPTGLRDDRSNLSVDFGYYALRLGNQVWEDTGAGANEDNGVFDTDETGISGVTVELWEDTDNSDDFDPTDDTLIATTTTDSEGNYWFEGLVNNTDYIVAIPDTDNNGTTEPLDGLESSTGVSATPSAADNDDDGTPDATNGYAAVSDVVTPVVGLTPTGETDVVPTSEDAEAEANAAGTTMPDANSDLRIDFGFIEPPTYEIGNLVWNDANNNGEVDAATESGIAGVLVQLWEDTTGDGNADTLVTSTNTNGSGNYNFPDLSEGDYVVVIPDDQATATTPTALDPFQPSSNGIEADPDTDRDNNTNGANALTGPGPVGNASGVLTVGEGTDLADEPINETDESPTGLRDDRSNLSVDFGYYALRLGNQVWEDTGAGANEDNGVFDTDETGISGVTVELWEDTDNSDDFDPTDDTLIATTTTDSEGNYWFEGLVNNTDYIVAIPEADNNGTTEPLDGLESSTGASVAPSTTENQDDGTPDATNSYMAVANVVTPVVGSTPTGETDSVPAEDAEAEANAAGTTHPDTNSNLRIDFGFIEPPTYEIGNLVWNDANNNGEVDAATESGIAGVLVQLWEDTTGDGNADTLVTSTNTNGSGNYNFPDLSEGDYVVVIPDDQSTATTPTALDPFQPSSNGIETDPDTDRDNNTNGANTLTGPGPVGNASGVLTVGEGTDLADEPINETDESPTGLRDDRSNLSVDFGYYEVSLGNQVWEDLNNDGDVDSGEPVFDGLELELYVDANGDGTPDSATPVATTTTNASGQYLFTGLVDGETYVVVIPAGEFGTGEPLEGFHTSTTTELDPDDDGDANDNGIEQADGSVRSGPVTLDIGDEPPGEDPDNDPNTPDLSENLTVDFGFYQLSVGNQVWYDHNNDGSIGGGEGPVVGLVVQLWEDTTGDGNADTLVDSTTTDASGLYLFDGLPEGDYVVAIPASEFGDAEPLDGHRSTTPTEADADVGGDGNDNGIPQANGSVQSSLFELSADDEPTAESPDNDPNTPDLNENLTIDFGFYQLRLGNQVWADIGAGSNLDNAVFDTDEVGIENVDVELWIDTDDSGDFDPTSDTFVEMTTTDSNGNYWFDSLIDDETYFVVIPEAGNDGAGEALEGTGSSSLTSAAASTLDNDDDGAPQTDYLSVSSPVTVNAGSTPTGETDTGDATGAEAEANAAGVALPDANSDLHVDFGFVTPPTFEIGNLVWRDDDNNGAVDPGEPGIEGVLVELWRDSDLDGVGDVLVDTEVTDPNGNYLFDLVFPGDYLVVIPTDQTTATDPTALDKLVSSDVGEETDPDDGADSNDNGVLDVDDSSTAGPVGLASGVFTIGEGIGLAEEPTDEDDESPNGLRDDRSNLSVDFGFYGLSLGNVLWHDVDNNGTIDGGEPPLEGVVVNLWEDTTGDGVPDTLIDSTVTDVDGFYLFEGLPAGDYVVEVPSSEFEDGAPLEHLTPSDDSVADPNTGTDVDSNGVEQPDGSVQTGIIELSAGGEPTGEAPSNDPNPADENSNLTVDLGFYGLTLGNNVFFDTDADGERDADEDGAEGVVVNVWADTDSDGTPDTLVDTTTTDANGHYLFTGLAAGDYIVEIPEQNFYIGGSLEGWISSTGGAEEADPNDDVDENDNGVDPASPGDAVLSAPVTLTAGGEPTDESDVPPGHDAPFDESANLTVDFGFYNLTLGNRIWNDVNNNGDIDDDESGLVGVVVELFNDADGDGVPDDADNDGEPDVVQSTVTDSEGYYDFEGLFPGGYIVGVPAENFVDGAPLEGMLSSEPTTADPEDNQDSDDNGIDPETPGATVFSQTIVLAANTEPTGEDDPGAAVAGLNDDANLTVDFGFFETAEVGNYVWLDRNQNGRQDDSEPPVSGVVVDLLDEDGNVIATDTTDADGLYLFEGLPPGTYSLHFRSTSFPIGHTVTTGSCSCPITEDSNLAPNTTTTTPFTLSPGESNLSFDVGLVGGGALALTGRSTGMVIHGGVLLLMLGLIAWLGGTGLGRRRRTFAVTKTK